MTVFKVLMAVVFGAMAVGQSSAFAPDFGEAQLSARRIIKLFDKESLIDPSDKRLEYFLFQILTRTSAANDHENVKDKLLSKE